MFGSFEDVRSVWLRYQQETLKKRFPDFEAKVAQEGLILTESQFVTMEKNKKEDKPKGQIEIEYFGSLGAQSVYYSSIVKGIGIIYHQTFIDNYSRVIFAKLYDRKNALIAAEILNDKVVPFFENEEISLL